MKRWWLLVMLAAGCAESPDYPGPQMVPPPEPETLPPRPPPDQPDNTEAPPATPPLREGESAPNAP